jgi:hypothetical protein
VTDIAGPSSAELAAIIEGRTAEEIAASIARHVRQAPLSTTPRSRPCEALPPNSA